MNNECEQWIDISEQVSFICHYWNFPWDFGNVKGIQKEIFYRNIRIFENFSHQ